ncbi:hypothetical protein [Methyloferula stellata]|uniref:hypothetical protein n=1 Tax=Methyloferula stellata TaxID=876270 RepID=UPI00036C891E|nr:hypothetical protein [Methyloferula stellata]
MRPQPEVIHLGAHEWRIRPLTLAQVQAIEPILMATQDKTGNVAAAIAIVSIALSRDHASAAESLAEIEATATEIAAAMTSVLRLGGFIETGAGASHSLGEA